MSKTVIKCVDDKEYVELMKKKVKENDGYCPCKLLKTEDTKCMCKEFKETKEGTCHCGLYVKTIVEDKED